MHKQLHSMHLCISVIKAWATVNMLDLNGNKTELMFIILKIATDLNSVRASITTSNALIVFKQSVKNMGFT